MPEPHRPNDRSAAARQGDHATLAALADSLVPALVTRLASSGLGEVEIAEGDWKVRVRRSTASARRADRGRSAGHAPAAQATPHPAHTAHPAAEPTPAGEPERAFVTSPAVGVFRPSATVGSTVRIGDRIATVDVLGIASDVAAPIDGVLVELFAQGGEGVEYGEDVAVIEVPVPAPSADEAGTSGAEG